MNGQVGHVAGMTLATAQQQQQRLGQDFLQGLFNTQVGRIFIGQVQGGVAAARVTAVRNGDMTAIARLATSSREAATQQIMGNLSGQMQEYAFTAVRARTDLNRARQAIGVDPATVPGATNAASNAAAPAR